MNKRKNNHELKVVGTGSVVVVPDRFQIRAEIKTLDVSAEKTKNVNDEKMRRLLERLTQLGFKEKDVQTVNYELLPQYSYENNQQTFLGYELVHQFIIESDDFEQLGTVIDELIKYEVTRIVAVHFTRTNEEELYQTALQLALHNSQIKARNLTTVLKVELQPIPMFIKELSSEACNPLLRTLQVEEFSSSSPIQRGEMTIHAVVEAIYTYN